MALTSSKKTVIPAQAGIQGTKPLMVRLDPQVLNNRYCFFGIGGGV